MPRASAAALLVMLCIYACDGAPEPTGPPNLGPAPARMVEERPGFDVVQEIVERGGCLGGSCHLSGQGELYMGFDPDVNYLNLVNVPAYGEPSFLRVDPGSSERSYVMIKLEGRQRIGSAMPPGGPPLDSIDLTNLRNWIDAGALEP